MAKIMDDTIEHQDNRVLAPSLTEFVIGEINPFRYTAGIHCSAAPTPVHVVEQLEHI